MPWSADDVLLRKTIVLSIFASIAVVLGIAESMIPFAVAVPGAKLGLGNMMVLTCLYYFNARDSLGLILLKTVITAFLLGSFSTFLFSLMGALGSFVVMYAMLRLGRGSFSLLGISVMGGVAHNVGQLFAASMVLGTTRIFYYLPFLLAAGAATGIFVGMSAKQLIAALQRIEWFRRREWARP
ncbi:Gx transporter family protein [Cohnella lubricantis]|uniref:Gx transporter family protein n=1 Tax=Cohnella lubricantis TaxID=2163172 RepID=A0A841TDT5_9BACL|nr:Gx transporter family protein [Cohnella lubricantis]MBB6679192.1 Gx transporter family protein [Cohnella lubricantis]MBP2120675.1 heptaprenyl diphosphate synthase [Cohnella lubricantis]